MKDIAVNKKAYHDYLIEEKYEAGLVLVGSEIKSIRAGKVSLKESYVSFVRGEAFVKDKRVGGIDVDGRRGGRGRWRVACHGEHSITNDGFVNILFHGKADGSGAGGGRMLSGRRKTLAGGGGRDRMGA